MSEFSAKPLTKSFGDVDGKRMAYHETGVGRAVVFLHGNPTSSYLWRNVIPYLSGQARCIVPDLIGHGDSAKLDHTGPGSYRFVEHRRYLDRLLEQLELGDGVVVVGHDWGSALGFDWANSHRDRVDGIAYMEALVRPLSWNEFPEAGRSFFRDGLRTPAGEEMVIEKNLFVEAVLPASMLRALSPWRSTTNTGGRSSGRATAARPGPGRARSPLTVTPPRLSRSSRATPTGSRPPTSRSCSSTATPGRSWSAPRESFCRSWPNQTEVTASPAATSSKKTAPARSARRSATGSRPCNSGPPGSPPSEPAA